MTASVVGGGLAGCEAAWQLAVRGIPVTLYEMKPARKTPAHKSDLLCELVCSNSLRGAAVSTGPGLLKEEMRRLGSLVIRMADEYQVPAGGALAVDREKFSRSVTDEVTAHPLIAIVNGLVETVPDGEVILATGPLTEGGLSDEIVALLGGSEPLHFYDAAAPIVSFSSVDMEQAYFASRYGKGDRDYINCPLTKEQYTAFTEALAGAEQADVHGFDDSGVFEGCLPVEVMARRGEDTLRFGPMKPVGLIDPKTGRMPYAVLQLRAENREGSMYNLVGFQTHLTFGEQRRVFRMIPALAGAEFLRYGVMHRNSFIESPGRLDRFYRVIGNERVMFAGQITGVEGYIESAASGLCAGLFLARRLRGQKPVLFSARTAVGALALHVSGYSGADFQPMNINFGLMEPLEQRIKGGKRARHEAMARRALEEIDQLKKEGYLE